MSPTYRELRGATANASLCLRRHDFEKISYAGLQTEPKAESAWRAKARRSSESGGGCLRADWISRDDNKCDRSRGRRVPATLYQFFPNKEAIASALTERYAREMAEAEKEIEAEKDLGFEEAVSKLLDFCMSYNRKYPEFYTLVLDAPLSEKAREEKRALGLVFVNFIAGRLRESNPSLTGREATYHGEVSLIIFEASWMN